MKTFLLKFLLASFALYLSHADAAVVITLPTATTTGSVVITNDISFTVTNAGLVNGVIFDEWVTSDGSNSNISGFTPDGISYQINGGATASTSSLNLYDNLATTVVDVTPNDGYFLWNTGITVAVNDVFTIKAATYSISAGARGGFNPQVNQTFAGNAFLASAGVRRSSVVSLGAVPEPSRALLMLGGLAGVLLRRRRMVCGMGRR